MGNKIFQAVVLIMWAATMSWLVVAKIMPPFFQGEPPRAGIAGRMDPIAWTVQLQGKKCGFSVSQATEGALGSRELHSRVMLEDLPLPEVAPPWAQSVLKGLGAPDLLKELGRLRLDLRNQVTFDSLGSLVSFQTKVKVNEISSLARVNGRVSGGKLRLRLQTGDYTRQSELPWRDSSMLGGQLSPEPKLLHVYVGRKWREEVYSPLRGPGSTAELLEAEVVDQESFIYAGELIRTNRIVYRSLSSAGVSSKDRLRAMLWVRDDGTVVRQDTYYMNACLRLTRLSPIESRRLAEEFLELDQFASTHKPKPRTREVPFADAETIEDEAALESAGESLGDTTTSSVHD